MDKQDDTLNIRIPKTLRLRLEVIAQREQRSLSNVVRVALGEWVEQKGRAHDPDAQDFAMQVRVQGIITESKETEVLT